MRTSLISRTIWGLVCLALAALLPEAALCADPSPIGVVSFQWMPPTHTIEGFPLTAPTGYKVHCGHASGQYDWILDTGVQTMCTVTGLARDCVYYFAVTAYATNGVESDFSAELTWAYGDLDVDGLQDAWELAHFGGLQGPDGEPGADADGDGLSNYEEFLAGTDPVDEGDDCRVYAGMTNHQVQVQFVAVKAQGPGYDQYKRIYDLESWDPVASPSPVWHPVAGCTSVEGAGQTVAHLVEAPGTYAARHYRACARLALQ